MRPNASGFLERCPKHRRRPQPRLWTLSVSGSTQAASGGWRSPLKGRLDFEGLMQRSMMPHYRPPPGQEAPAFMRPLDFLERAEEFFVASRQIGPVGFLNWPRYQCACHAIELALKAYLASKGECEHQLRAYGHDLDAAMQSAQRQGLVLRANTVRAIQLLSPVHKELLQRYPMRTGLPIPTIEQFDGDVMDVLETLCEALRGHRSYRAFVSY